VRHIRALFYHLGRRECAQSFNPRRDTLIHGAIDEDLAGIMSLAVPEKLIVGRHDKQWPDGAAAVQRHQLQLAGPQDATQKAQV
jgi:hypothetical protein